MTPEKAIKLLKKDLDDPGSVDISDLNEAQQLGIEALELILSARTGLADICLSKLPSETEE